MIPCPCCKKTVPAPTVEMVVDHLHLTKLQAQILKAVWRGKGQPVPTEAIIAAMDQAESTKKKSRDYVDFKVVLCRLRQRLKPLGIVIQNTGYARGYHIELPWKVGPNV